MLTICFYYVLGCDGPPGLAQPPHHPGRTAQVGTITIITMTITTTITMTITMTITIIIITIITITLAAQVMCAIDNTISFMS
jgi:hypothetical protein